MIISANLKRSSSSAGRPLARHDHLLPAAQSPFLLSCSPANKFAELLRARQQQVVGVVVGAWPSSSPRNGSLSMAGQVDAGAGAEQQVAGGNANAAPAARRRISAGDGSWPRISSRRRPVDANLSSTRAGAGQK